MNFLLLHCYGGLLQHNQTGSPITVATSGYTNARENNGNRRGVVIKTRNRDKTYASRQWYRRDTAVFPWFTHGSGCDRYTSASRITGPIRLTRMNINHSAYICSVLRRKWDEHCIPPRNVAVKWMSCCFVTQKFRVQIMARKQRNLARVIRHLLQSFHVNMRTVPRTRPWQNPFTSFPIHYSLLS